MVYGFGKYIETSIGALSDFFRETKSFQTVLHLVNCSRLSKTYSLVTVMFVDSTFRSSLSSEKSSCKALFMFSISCAFGNGVNVLALLVFLITWYVVTVFTFFLRQSQL